MLRATERTSSMQARHWRGGVESSKLLGRCTDTFTRGAKLSSSFCFSISAVRTLFCSSTLLFSFLSPLFFYYFFPDVFLLTFLFFSYPCYTSQDKNFYTRKDYLTTTSYIFSKKTNWNLYLGINSIMITSYMFLLEGHKYLNIFLCVNFPTIISSPQRNDSFITD